MTSDLVKAMIRLCERESGMIPAKKKAGLSSYVSSQPTSPVVKRRRMVSDLVIVKLARARIPASKRPKSKSTVTRA